MFITAAVFITGVIITGVTLVVTSGCGKLFCLFAFKRWHYYLVTWVRVRTDFTGVLDNICCRAVQTVCTF